MFRFFTIASREDLERMIASVGVLPFFRNAVPGWSVEEHADPSVWFTGADGPWEWKGPMAYEKRCVYGKFIRNKAAFVSPGWFGDLANWRRQCMSFEERVEAGLVPRGDRLLMDYLRAHPFTQSRWVKRECGFEKGYDQALTRLQMLTYVIDQDFQYSIDRCGRPYGWGNAVLCPAEDWAGDALRVPEDREPEDSFERLVAHLMKRMPDADEAVLRRELR